jgi:hypothetical protein
MKTTFSIWYFFQNSYSIEEGEDDDSDDSENEDNESTNKKDRSIFNFVAVGDWDCTGETEYFRETYHRLLTNTN